MAALAMDIGGMEYALEAAGIGAGAAKTLEELENFLRSSASEVALGSFTFHRQLGNQGGETFYLDEATGNSVNSKGLDNRGFRWLIGSVRDIVGLAKKYGKRVRISLSGAADEIFSMLRELIPEIIRYDGCRWVIIEINLACPNTVDESGHHHPVIAYDPLTVGHIVSGAYLIARGQVPLAFKLAPYDQKKTEERVIRTCLRQIFCSLTPYYPGQVELVLCNTLGKQRRYRSDGSPALGVTDNLGGAGGAELYPYTLDNVGYFANAPLPTNLSLVGMGGLWDKDPVVMRTRVTRLLIIGRHQMRKVLITTGPYAYGARAIDELHDALV